jgi:hypothetical protein
MNDNKKQTQQQKSPLGDLGVRWKSLTMKTNLHILIFSFLLSITFSVEAQKIEYIPDLSKVKDLPNWIAINREIIFDEYVSLNGKPGDGLLYIDDFEFKNGKIELDIKGKNDPGRSFVGVAFHILNDSTYDAVYFRPFNFRNPDRKNHSVQYISMPDHDWSKLRETFPGKYENKILPVPDPNGWFHATIEIAYPKIKVFVDHSEVACLIIDQISKREKGWVGFWVGNTSEGSFKNLKITTKSN